MPDLEDLRRKVNRTYTLPLEEMEQFCAVAAPMELKKGQLLLREGQVCHSIYYVRTGYLRAYHLVDGLEINTGLYFEDSFATSLKSLRLQLPSESFIAAGEPCSLYRFDREPMLNLYARSPLMVEFGKRVLELLAIGQEEHANLFKLYNAEQRFRHIEQHHPEMLQRVPLSYLSSYLGVARETLSRFRRK